MPTSRINVNLSGPLFDGRADAAVKRYLAVVKEEVAQIGHDWIALEAETYDKSGRGGTGRAAESVKVVTTNLDDKAIRGDSNEGQVWWPWLEGTSKRNFSTRWRGYRTFRRMRGRLRKYATPYAQKRLADFIGEMGGR